jgi:RNA-binding motif X-linked protein 2
VQQRHSLSNVADGSECCQLATMNTIREIQKINDQELAMGIAGTPASWHAKYAKSAWIYVGNLDHTLTEGDVICVLSQYGEIEDFHLIREEDTGKSRGFAFAKYEDARSCVLAVDNFCGIQLCGRSLRIDHVENYRLPKHIAEKEDIETEKRTQAGHAYHGKDLANEYSIDRGQDLFALPPANNPRIEDRVEQNQQQDRKKQKEKKRKRKEERDRKRSKREEKRRGNDSHAGKEKKRKRKHRETSAPDDEKEMKKQYKEKRSPK